MNNKYIDKYLKYKNKYLNFKNKINQSAGYLLSDENKSFLLGKILKIIEPNSDYFDFTDTTHKIKNFDETLNFLTNNKDYTQIIKYLLDTYTMNKSYKQIFKNKNGIKIYESTVDVFPYHINFAALMFLSFITELEIVTLLHSFIGYNTIEEPKNNNIISAYYGHTTSNTHIYKNTVNLSITDKLKLFTKTLDDIFNNFMKLLVDNIAIMYNKTNAEILPLIVPLEHYLHVDGMFDFIYVDWKNRIEYFISSVMMSRTITQNNIIYDINGIIKKCIQNIETKYTDYIEDGAGFFSFMFLINPADPNFYYGSCLTQSMFELYIMSRLHTHGDNMILLVEKDPTQIKPHAYWQITQQKSKIQILTHFATKYKFSTNPFELRSFYKPVVAEINFKKNRDQVLKLIIYFTYDMYLEILTNGHARLILKDNKENVDKLLLFIRNRVEEIENYFPNKLTDIEMENYLYIESNNSNILKNVGLDQYLKQDIEMLKKIITYKIMQRLIDNVLLSKNYELIKKLMLFIYDNNLDQVLNNPTILETLLKNKIDDKDVNQILDIINIYIDNSKKKGIILDTRMLFNTMNTSNIIFKKGVRKIFNIIPLSYDGLCNMVTQTFRPDTTLYIYNEITENPKLIIDINTRLNKYGQSLLYTAARSGNNRLVTALLMSTKDINVNVRTTNNSTPLHGAAFGLDTKDNFDSSKTCRERAEIINSLLTYKADKSLTNDYNEVPYDNIRCNESGTAKEMKILLKN